MHAGMHACACVYTYAQTQKIHVCVYILEYTHAYMHAYVHACMHTNLCSNVHTQAHVYVLCILRVTSAVTRDIYR